jgi:hypothetical protein
MLPEVGVSIPETRLMKVVFPAPFGPIRPTISPSAMEKETSFTAVSPPKLLVTFVTLKISFIA